MIQLTHQIAETILWDMDNINIHFISCLSILDSSANCWTSLQETSTIYRNTIEGEIYANKVEGENTPQFGIL